MKNKRSARPGALSKAGEVAGTVGIGVQTLHYYERLGLLPKPQRSAANYRLYPPEVVRRVQFIRKAQILGFKLAEIKQILEMKSHGHPRAIVWLNSARNIYRRSISDSPI